MASCGPSEKDLQLKLRKAVQQGETNVICRLVKGGVSVNDTTWFDTTLLHEAVVLTDPSDSRPARRNPVVSMLLKHGANINAGDKNDRTPLHYVSRVGYSDTVELLLKQGACANAITKDGRSPLHVALWQGRESATLKLIEYGADVNIADEDGTTPLHWAVKLNNIEVMMHLLEKGANINAQDKKGWSPLHYSVRSRMDVMRILLSQGADMALKTNDGRTVMHVLDEPVPSSSPVQPHAARQVGSASVRFKMLVMVGYPIHLDHMLIQRQLKIFQTEEGLLDWINEVEDKYKMSLLHLCRLCIRRHLTNIRGSKMLEDKLFDLEGTLPDSLIKSLWMIDDFVELKSLTR